jgi:hypothetical protein
VSRANVRERRRRRWKVDGDTVGDTAHRGVGIIVGARARCRRLRRRRQGRGFRRAHPARGRVADADRFAIRYSDSHAAAVTIAERDSDAAPDADA